MQPQAHHASRTCAQSLPYLTGDPALLPGHEVTQRTRQLAEPEAVVRQCREPVGDLALECQQLARQGELLEGGVRVMQHHRTGSLVDLAALDADKPILDVVDAPDAVRACQLVELLDELDAAHPTAV